MFCDSFNYLTVCGRGQRAQIMFVPQCLPHIKGSLEVT